MKKKVGIVWGKEEPVVLRIVRVKPKTIMLIALRQKHALRRSAP